MNLSAVEHLVGSVMTCTGTLQKVISVDLDPDTLKEVVTYETTYDGRLLIWPDTAGMRDADAGEYSWHIKRYVVTLPVDTTVEEGHVLTITAAPGDPELVGLTVNIIDAPVSAWSVGRLCLAEWSS